jgi:hypothetical protein
MVRGQRAGPGKGGHGQPAEDSRLREDHRLRGVDANGASDFLVAALGENGRHSRSAVGTAALPLGAPVEVEAIIEIDGQ